ncbi:predicted protein [Nematostella vectensis]|uniref:Endonuclease/exonuclease/phosphatase domain-containing protein n=1 Tax=Nematostella vectensis TaxID=45351 RepID=A7SFF1_NEMVE|nr:predicted protein [Nematostella vectensis]|eukprot:XP_001629609.1 predicted protein [Nematostella vectensis]
MKDPHKLRVLTLNACSLKGKDKRLEFQSLIDNYKPDIVNVNETHINDTVFSAEILEKGYTIFRKDRNEFGGGVLSAFSNHLVVTHEEQMDGNYEGIWSKINIAGSKSLFVGSVYRTPDSNVDPLVALDGALCKLVKNPIPNILITGDLNLPSISWEDDNYAKNLAKAHSEYVSQLLTVPEGSETANHTITKRFWTYIKSKKTHDVDVAPLRDDKGELVSDSLVMVTPLWINNVDVDVDLQKKKHTGWDSNPCILLEQVNTCPNLYQQKFGF